MKLSASTSGFVLSAAISVLFNTALACMKDVNAPLKAFMTSLTGHDWTTQGLADLVLFAALGFILTNTAAVEKMDPSRLIALLIGSVAIAGFGLVLWFAFV